MQKELLRFSDLKALGYVNNRVTLSRWIRRGIFPAPIRLGPNTAVWIAEDVRACLNKAKTATKPPADRDDHSADNT